MTIEKGDGLRTMSLGFEELELTALQSRRDIVDMVYRAKAGHPGGSLSVIDILIGLYGTQLRVSTSNPDHPDRDRLILSKGHASPAMYAALRARGYLNESDL